MAAGNASRLFRKGRAMDIMLLAAALAAAQFGWPAGPYPVGYTDTDHAIEYGYTESSYPSQAALDAARLRYRLTHGLTAEQAGLSTGVEVFYGQ